VRIVNHDDADKVCLTCANAFVTEDSYHDTYLCCILQDGGFVDDDDTCDEWN